MNAIHNFFTKNIILIAIFSIFWWLVVPGSPEIKLINKLVLLEIVTLFLCQLAVYVHYRSPVTYSINTGDDNKVNSVEQHSLIAANSRIYQGVHLFVALIVLGVYVLEKNP